MTDTERDAPAIPPVLAAAVVAAWAELGNVTKGHTANAGAYSYAYSDLADLVDMVRPILAKHGLALLQPTTRDAGDATVTIETWLVHTSGHVLRWSFAVSAQGSPQQIGSAITYGRRYAAHAALGVASEDDDGQAAAKALPVELGPPVEDADKPLPRRIPPGPVDVPPRRDTRKSGDQTSAHRAIGELPQTEQKAWLARWSISDFGSVWSDAAVLDALGQPFGGGAGPTGPTGQVDRGGRPAPEP